MNNAAATSLTNLAQNLRQTDIRAVANRYAAQLQLCCPHSPTSFPLALTIHAHMIASGFKPHGHILNRLMDVYCKSSYLVYARHLFDEIPRPDVVSRTTLIAAYASAGDPRLAREIFDRTPLRIRDSVCYNAMITGYSHNNDGHAAIELFREMRWNGFQPDNFTFTSVLGALALVADHERHCQQLHSQVVKSGTGDKTSVLNALTSVYVKCASSPSASSSLLMGAARKLFEETPVKDELSWTTIITGYVRNDDLDAAHQVFIGMSEKLVVAWNAMISGYVQKGRVSQAFEMFRKMHGLGVKHDEFTYTSTLSACADTGLFRHGKQVHAYILRTEEKPTLDFTLSVSNALISLYWKCGKVDEARKIFEKMPIKDIVSRNAILSAYVGSGRVTEARSFFSEMPERNLLTWTVMISGCAHYGLAEEGLKLFSQMRSHGLEPCDYAFAGAITSCAVLGSLENGRQLHAQLVRLGFDSSLSAGNALITMLRYQKLAFDLLEKSLGQADIEHIYIGAEETFST
ncbi:hypothetical protein RJ639_023957 [Escallonia herrerae]|uniref:Pentatricopeptide repeat-containing protein n=1 Tax=Escallonia herrerae TaxID=1293975 RepID=A0AA88UZ37_9ASTE|nr:hypothetical protein RJ639_023957 [Escallonia herrerae]